MYQYVNDKSIGNQELSRRGGGGGGGCTVYVAIYSVYHEMHDAHLTDLALP